MKQNVNRKKTIGFSLVELLCVMTIIAILMSLMLPVFAKALRKARGMGGHLGSSSGIQMRIDEVAEKYSRYRSTHLTHGKLNRNTFARELRLSPEADAWLCLSSIEFRPFAAVDPPDQPAIIVYPSRGGGSGPVLVIFKIGDLKRPISGVK